MYIYNSPTPFSQNSTMHDRHRDVRLGGGYGGVGCQLLKSWMMRGICL